MFNKIKSIIKKGIAIVEEYMKENPKLMVCAFLAYLLLSGSVYIATGVLLFAIFTTEFVHSCFLSRDNSLNN